MTHYVVVNPEEVVDLGIDNIRKRIHAEKSEVVKDISAFIYYPCLAVKEGGATYADVTAAFYYKGFYSEDADSIFNFKSLKRHFRFERREDDTIYLRFKIEDIASKYKVFNYDCKLVFE